MLKKLIRLIMTLAGVSTGVAVATSVMTKVSVENYINIPLGAGATTLLVKVLSGLILGLIIFILSPFIMKLGTRLAKYIEREILKIPSDQFLVGFLGLLFGGVMAYLIHGLLKPVFFGALFTNVVGLSLYLFLGYLGVRVALSSKVDFSKVIEYFNKSSLPKKTSDIRPKVLDTSVIIDGRLLDICKTKFLEGPLVIPEFVLKELRHIADASDPLKRKRGRRGLDILNKLQTEIDNEVIIDNTDFKDESEVDIKLLKLALKINGMVATHDYNLNKVAIVHGVDILNINALANAVKPVVIPGEEMTVEVVKEGKENNQGLAYLDDGTMIVVEDGKALIGKTVVVVVTTALQTAAGKMIFVKVK